MRKPWALGFTSGVERQSPLATAKVADSGGRDFADKFSQNIPEWHNTPPYNEMGLRTFSLPDRKSVV